MTDPDDRVRASITFADYVGIDALGKANIIGAGIRVLVLRAAGPGMQRLTSPCALFVALVSDLPTDGDAPAVELALTTSAGTVVDLPFPDGQSRALRIGQTVEFAAPAAIGHSIPAHVLPSTAQFAVAFPTGLPLQEGFSYQWRVQADHEVIGSYSFYVPAEPQPPVVG